MTSSWMWCGTPTLVLDIRNVPSWICSILWYTWYTIQFITHILWCGAVIRAYANICIVEFSNKSMWLSKSNFLLLLNSIRLMLVFEPRKKSPIPNMSHLTRCCQLYQNPILPYSSGLPYHFSSIDLYRWLSGDNGWLKIQQAPGIHRIVPRRCL